MTLSRSRGGRKIDCSPSIASIQVLGDLYSGLNVQYNLPWFPDIHVTYEHTTVMLGPKAYCHPNNFLFSENRSDMTIEAHRFLNGKGNNSGCPHGQFQASVRYT